VRPLPLPPRCRGIPLGDGNYTGCAYGYGDVPPFTGPRDCPVCNGSGFEGPIETTMPHSDFGDPDCSGCLNGVIRGDQADIVCNECGTPSSPSSVSLCRTRSRDSQQVTPFVIRLPGVSSDVYPRHLVVAGQLLELLPQIPIHHWLSSGGSPAVGLPPRKELGDSPAYILGVGQHGDLAGTLQSPTILPARISQRTRNRARQPRPGLHQTN
jgi:hypothetical protein